MNLFKKEAGTDLQEHSLTVGKQHISNLFKQNPNRFEELSFSFGDMLLDFSKQRVTKKTIKLLSTLAEQCDLKKWINDLYSGVKINTSEDRPALHTALRSPRTLSLQLNNEDVIQQVHENLDRMETLVEKFHSGQWLGYTGSPINTVVNIGVGGSDLGPFMTSKALTEFTPSSKNKIELHFVSSMDGSHLSNLLETLDPCRTLFIISSKSFSTIDTLANAANAREWIKQADQHANTPEELLIKQHFIGVSASPEKMIQWGIPSSNHLYFWDWTGGRYSLWSTIGLPIALRIGMQNFRELLAGAHEMDNHFKESPFDQNLPVLLAMIGIWNINFLGITAHAILPYDGRLSHLPSYLEQLEMESNGKCISRQNETLNFNTCPILWGEIGTNAQHAFYQLLHQGTLPVMCDFIACSKRYENSNSNELKRQHQLNLSNCLAQSQILALGDSVIENAENSPLYKRYRGNQPCTTILLERLTPHTFGMLIALYEHKVFVQSVIWDINPFDQWGVELGKTIATNLLPAIEDPSRINELDNSTRGLISHIHR
ncbi:MAG: glucose-6-phosphate isomerase [Oceanospirillales bacterium]|nr:MAG: glucose-6-phosphate isomerase [Oceanospirillales bacterium]